MNSSHFPTKCWIWRRINQSSVNKTFSLCPELRLNSGPSSFMTSTKPFPDMDFKGLKILKVTAKSRDSVSWHYFLAVFPGIISWQCSWQCFLAVHRLPGSVSWQYMYSLAVFPGSVSWQCFLAVFPGSVSWQCFLAVFPGSISWHYSLALFPGSISWQCSWHYFLAALFPWSWSGLYEALRVKWLLYS